MSRVFRVAGMWGLMLLVGAGWAGNSNEARAQSKVDPAIAPASQSGALPSGDPLLPAGPRRERMDEQRRDAINDSRQKRLQADVDKLLALTNELKTDIDKANKDELSLEVIRKAQEIEKLAHDVQNRMKN